MVRQQRQINQNANPLLANEKCNNEATVDYVLGKHQLFKKEKLIRHNNVNNKELFDVIHNSFIYYILLFIIQFII